MNASWPIKSIGFILFMLFSACGLFRKSSKYKPEPILSNFEKHIADSMLQVNRFTYEWLNAKCKIKITDTDGTMDLTANIRAKQDSSIWVSVSPLLGIEVMRILFTQDSVRILDRFNKKNETYSYEIIKRFTNIPVDFYTIQDLIRGNALYYDPYQGKIVRHDTTLVLNSSTDKLNTFVYLNRQYRILKMFIQNNSDNKTLTITNGDYTMEAQKPFALHRTWILHDGEESMIELDFSKIILNEPQKFPFSNK